MSGSYRLLIVATCGVIAFLLLGIGAFYGSLYSPDHKQYGPVGAYSATHNDYRGPTESLPSVAGIPGPAERAIANPPPHSGQDHEKRDLAAQEAMAVWAFWMAGASILTVGVTTAGTILIYQQVKLTRKAVEDTNKATNAMERQNDIAEAAQRAWIVVEPKIIEAKFEKGGINITWDCFFRNIGKTVAREAEFSAVLRCDAPPDLTVVPNCIIEAKNNLAHTPANVIPNEALPTFGGAMYKMVEGMGRIEPIESVSIIVAAVARYKINADEGWHFTERAYAVTFRNRWFTLLDTDFQNITTESLVFKPLGEHAVTT